MKANFVDGLLGEPDEYARLVRDMKKANLIKDHRVGLIKTHKNAFKGQDLIDWLIKVKKIGKQSDRFLYDSESY